MAMSLRIVSFVSILFTIQSMALCDYIVVTKDGQLGMKDGDKAYFIDSSFDDFRKGFGEPDSVYDLGKGYSEPGYKGEGFFLIVSPEGKIVEFTFSQADHGKPVATDTEIGYGATRREITKAQGDATEATSDLNSNNRSVVSYNINGKWLVFTLWDGKVGNISVSNLKDGEMPWN